MYNEKVKTIFAYLFIILVAYIFILAAFVKSPSYLQLPSFLVLGYLGLSALIMVSVCNFISKINIKPALFLGLLIIATLSLRVFWILSVNTLPCSDFVLYNNYAINASKGVFTEYDPSYPVFPFKFGYPLLLSILYKIFGTNIMIIKIFNILISICTSLQIYCISKKIFDEKAARISSLLYAIWPAQIMFTSVAASEHIYLLLLLLSFQLFLQVLGEITNKKRYVYSIGTGIAIALTQFIRPTAIMLLPILLFYLFVFMHYNNFKAQSII